MAGNRTSASAKRCKHGLTEKEQNQKVEVDAKMGVDGKAGLAGTAVIGSNLPNLLTCFLQHWQALTSSKVAPANTCQHPPAPTHLPTASIAFSPPGYMDKASMVLAGPTLTRCGAFFRPSTCRLRPILGTCRQPTGR